MRPLRRPLVFMAAGTAAGVAAAERAGLETAFLAAGLAAFGLIVRKIIRKIIRKIVRQTSAQKECPGKQNGICLSAGLLWALLGAFLILLRTVPLYALEKRVEAQALSGRMQRFTVESSDKTGSGFRVFLSGEGVSGRLLWYTKEEYPVGTLLEAKGEFSRIRNAGNPGEWDKAGYFRLKGVYYQAEVKEVHVLHEGRGNIFEHYREMFSERCTRYLPAREAGVLAAMLWGDDELMDPEISENFRKIGISHVLAISGMHVGIIYALFRKLLEKRLSRRGAGRVGVCVIWLYTLVTGCGVSTLRAAVLCTVHGLSAAFFGREDSLNTYAISALVLLWIQPLYLLDLGFRLSFAGALFLTFGSLFFRRMAFLPEKLREAFGSVLAVFLGVLPISLSSGGYFSPYQLISNLLVLPAVGFLFPMGLVVGTLADIWPQAASFGSGSVYVVIRAMELYAEFVLRLPGAVLYTGRPRELAVCLYYAAWALWYLGRMPGWNEKKSLHWIPAAAAAGAFLVLLWPEPLWRCTFLNVGQGDCCVVESRGNVFIVDAGPEYERALVPYLLSRGATHISGVFISHGDLDHVEGLLKLSEDERFRVDAWYLPDDEAHEEGKMLQIARNGACVYVQAGDTIRSGTLVFRVVSPQKRLAYPDGNSASMVIELIAASTHIVFCGDADIWAEDAFGPLIGSCDVLKAGHHGSRTSTGERFLAAVKPEAAVISCDREGQYGHPHEETMKRLEAYGVKPYVTDDVGAVTVVADGKGYRIMTGR